jgi:hypothetical protein
MKKALAGPAKPAAKKKPERRAMIAAARRRIRTAPSLAAKLTRAAPSLAGKLTRRVDRAANRALLRAWPRLERWGRRAGATALRWSRRAGRLLRPVVAIILRALGLVERRLVRTRDLTIRAATQASGVLTPERALCTVIIAAAACLVASQFIVYRGVEIGQPGYAGLPAASPPTVGAKTAGEAHSYLLIPVALLAAALAGIAMRKRRRRLGRIVFGLGLVSLAVILLVDLPAGLDAGAQAARFSGARAVLEDGFAAELASAAGLMLGGLLLVSAPRAAARYHARRCRTRTSSLERAASALRRRRRRRASSRARAGRRPWLRRSGAASAPASRP